MFDMIGLVSDSETRLSLPFNPVESGRSGALVYFLWRNS